MLTPFSILRVLGLRSYSKLSFWLCAKSKLEEVVLQCFRDVLADKSCSPDVRKHAGFVQPPRIKKVKIVTLILNHIAIKVPYLSD